MKNVRKLFSIILPLLLVCQTAYTSDDIDTWLSKNVHLHGFLSQNWVKTDDNDYFGPSSNSGGSWKFSESALGTYVTLSSKTTFSGQLLYRTTDGPNDGFEVDYAFLNHTFLDTDYTLSNIKLGRIKNTFGFYNETRDVPFSRPSIILPDFYQDTTRSFVMSGDGVGMDFSYETNDWGLFIDYSYNKNRTDETLEYSAFGFDTDGKFDSDTTQSFKIQLDIPKTNIGTINIALSGGELEYSYKQGGDIIPEGDITVRPIIASLRLSSQEFEYVTEYVDRKNILDGFGYDKKNRSEQPSYYHQLTYHPKHDVDLILRYESMKVSQNDKSNSQEILPDHVTYSKGYVLGAGWYITDDLLLRAEFHHKKGTKLLPRWNNKYIGISPEIQAQKGLSIADVDEHWNLFLLQMSYRFTLN